MKKKSMGLTAIIHKQTLIHYNVGALESERHLAYERILHLLDVVICGDMVANNKLAPYVFLKAGKVLGMKSENFLALGDTPADFEVAWAVGE